MANGSRVLVEDPLVDLEITEAMIRELEEYLVKEDVYRTVIVSTSGGDQNVRMTGGDLLARLHRLQGERALLTPGQQQRLDRAQEAADAAIYSLKTRFEQRLQREMKARIDSLRWYLDELDVDRPRGRVDFPFEMRNRQRIEEILKQLGNNVPSDLKTMLFQIDKRIREVAHATDFIWDARVEKTYPRETYWYLYMLP
jgi:hypothetical protein